MRKGFGTGALLVFTLAVSMLTFQGVSSVSTDGVKPANQPMTASEILPPGSPLPKNCDLKTDPTCKRCMQFCPERTLLDVVSGFFGYDAADEDTAKHWGVPVRARASTRFVVAIVPDPVHTHLGLFFDRSIDAIGQAAQQAGYVFDRATMPWDNREHPESTDYRIRKGQEGYQRVAEELPGLMIFRPANPEATGSTSLPAAPGPLSPSEALIVFVIGETPTGGIHKDQFENALLRMATIRKGSRSAIPEVSQQAQEPSQNTAGGHSTVKTKKKKADQKEEEAESLFIIGPTFSGSLYSLKELLIGKAAHFASVFVHSGTASSWETVQWLEHQHLNGLQFVTFQEGDRYALRRFLHFASDQGYRPQDIAVLSEEETAYGNFEVAHKEANCDPETKALEACEKQKPDSCEKPKQSLQLCTAIKQELKREEEVVRLYFPREISQLRSAYQRDLGVGGEPDSAMRQVPRSTLHLNLEDSGTDEDGVPAYSRLQTPLSQESVLLGITTSLRAHHTQFVLLRATNPLDQLFLARYLRTAFPEGRVVTSGADLLFRRETDSSLLHGLFAISSYSLIPRADDSTAAPNTEQERIHVDRVFPSSFSVGIYNAMLSLLSCVDYKTSIPHGKPCPVPNEQTGGRQADLPTALYAEYGWPSIAQDEPARFVAAPPLRLTVLGRDGYWNLAVLDSQEYAPSANDIPSSLHAEAQAATPKPFQPHLHQPWRLLWGLCIGIVLAYALLISRGSVFSASEALAIFAPLPDLRRESLFVVAGLLQLVMLLSLMWPWERWTNADDWANGREHWFWALLVWFVFIGCTWLAKYRGTRLGTIAGLCLLLMIAVVLWFWSHNSFWALHFGSWCTSGWRFWPTLTLMVLGTLALRRNKAGLFLVLSAILTTGGFWLFERGTNSDANILLYRYIHITSGVSPLLPWLLLFAAGMWWAWYGIAGLALLDQRRPRLPESAENPRFYSLTEVGNRKLLAVLYPASWDYRVFLAPALALLITWVVIDKRHPLQSLEGGPYDRLYTEALLVVVFVLLCTLLRLAVTWLECRRLLVALDSLPLRRGFRWLDGFSWKPIWRVRGGVLQESLRILRREVESLHRFSNALPPDSHDFDCLSKLAGDAEKGQHDVEQKFASADKTVVTSIEQLHEQLAQTCVRLFDFLQSRWTLEKGTEVSEANASEGGKVEEIKQKRVPATDVQSAEEFVCLVYVNFILAILMRMRTLVMAVAGMFVFLVLSISSYPFEPKQALRSLMVLLLVIIAVFVTFVYAQMHRDPTLSRITDTKPGELGLDFWLRLAGFGAVPLLSVLVAQYPEINSFLFSWLQPALEALK